MRHETIDGWGAWGGKGGVFVTPVPGPRWLDLWIAAGKAIQRSGNVHHRFIESFQADPEKQTELNMFAGSRGEARPWPRHLSRASPWPAFRVRRTFGDDGWFDQTRAG